LQITPFPRHIFWQYQPDADLPDLVVLEKLLLYGDLDDLLKIPQFFSNQQIMEIQKKIDESKRWKKEHFLFVIFYWINDDKYKQFVRLSSAAFQQQ
jgi:hypothetical protein